MIKQAGTAGYVSISGRKIAAILLILICSFALAWATRSGKGNKSDISVKPAQALMGGRPGSPATHNHSTAAGKTHTHHRQGALSNFKPHSTPSSGARHSKGAGQGANLGAGQGANNGVGQDANQGAGRGANSKSDTTPSPTPEENLSPTSDTTLGSSATITGTSRWPRAAATPAPLP